MPDDTDDVKTPRPVEYCEDPKRFGLVDHVAWRMPEGGTEEHQRHAILQHFSVVSLRRGLRSEDVTLDAYAEALKTKRTRLSSVLHGAWRMQFQDLANAAALCAEALPDPDAVAGAVTSINPRKGRRPRQPPIQSGPHITGFSMGSDLRWPEPSTGHSISVEVKTYTPEEERHWQHQERSLHVTLGDHLKRYPGFGADLEVRPRREDDGPARALVVSASVKTYAFVTVDWTWCRDLAAGRVGTLAGIFVIRALDWDDKERTRSAIALRPLVDPQTDQPVLVDAPVHITWPDAEEGPRVAWLEEHAPVG